MMTSDYFVPKRTGTHADVLAAIGVANLIQESEIDAQIFDKGAAFLVSAKRELTEEDLKGCDIGYKYLKTKSKEEVPEIVAAFDYEAERDKWNRSIASTKKIKSGAHPDEVQSMQEDRPHEDFIHYRVLNILQGEGPTNKVALWLSELGDKRAEVLFQGIQNITGEFGPERTAVSLFSPLTGKGVWRLKPDSTAAGNPKTEEGFLDYLRYRGFLRAQIPYTVGDDIRLLCPEPQNISYKYYERVVSDLGKERIYGSSVRIDCLGTLTLAKLLIQASEHFPTERRRPAQLISGLVATHFQSMGNAKAVMGLERLALPGWFELKTAEDAVRWLSVLDEHINRLKSLDADPNKSNSDELNLLILYRRFLEDRGDTSFQRFAEFLESYGIYVLRKRAQGNWRYKMFQTDHLEAVLSETDYTEILNNPGFQAVAKALREATVNAQWRKAQSKKGRKLSYREIRYDILPELKRKRNLPKSDEFVDAVSEFIAEYNFESSRRLENDEKSSISRISDADFADFLSLVHRDRSPSMLGALLCAYATCKAPQKDKTGFQEIEGEE